MTRITDRIDKIANNKTLDLRHLPEMARIEITGFCTLNCKYCYSKELKKLNLRQSYMSFENFNKCLSYVKRLNSIKEVGLFYMGESSLHPNLDVYYKMLKDNGFFTFLTTNGTNVKNVVKAIPYIDSLKLSWNYIDFEDFRDKTSINSIEVYDSIIKNSNTLFEECHKHKKEFFISTILDTDSKSKYDNALSKLKCDQHYWLPLQSQCGYVKTGNPGVIGQSMNTVEPIPCWSLFKGLYIDVDLNVHTCCYGNNNQHILFNILDENNTYLCEKLIQMRKQHLMNEIPVECKNCLT